MRDCLHSSVKNGSSGSPDVSYSKSICVSAFSGFPIYIKFSRRQGNTEYVRVHCSKLICCRGQALFFQYTLFWTNTSTIIKICTLTLVHNFVVSLKRTPLSCRSHFFVWKIHWSLTLPVHFSFSRGCQKIMKQRTLPLSEFKSSLAFEEKYCLHIFRISCCAQNVS